MALSTLRPFDDQLHQQRFPGWSLFAEPWLSRFRSLEERGLAVVDDGAKQIRLTPNGEVLVEAVINSEL